MRQKIPEKDVKNHGAPGDEGVTIDAVKLGRPLPLQEICTFFNTCVDRGVAPS